MPQPHNREVLPLRGCGFKQKKKQNKEIEGTMPMKAS
jgi:hypothetical protein